MSSYIPIASQTLGSSASSVTFSSIPTTLNGKTLRDLVLVSSYTVFGIASCFIRLNSDTGSNYSSVYAVGTGSSAMSGGYGNNRLDIDSDNSTQSTDRVQTIVQFFDFAQTNKHKSVLLRKDNPTSRGTLMQASRWANTNAITSILISSDSSYLAGSTFSLYGIEG
jgi:hypothetical protein